MPLSLVAPITHWLDLSNQVHNVSLLQLITKWPAVKVEQSKKMSVLVVKRTVFLLFQLWRTAILEPVGVQRHNVHHFKGLIVHNLDSRSLRAWQHFYLPPRRFEKRLFYYIKFHYSVLFYLTNLKKKSKIGRVFFVLHHKIHFMQCE